MPEEIDPKVPEELRGVGGDQSLPPAVPSGRRTLRTSGTGAKKKHLLPSTPAKGKPGKKEFEYRKLLSRIARRDRDFQFVLEEWIKKVHRLKDGDQQGVQMDDFNFQPLEKAQETVVDLFMHQELCKIIGLDKEHTLKLMSNLIDRRVPPPVRVVAQATRPPQG